MTNEEKILNILEGMQGDIKDLRQDFSGLKQDVNGLKEDVSGLKQDVSMLKEDVSGLKQDVSMLKEDVSGLKQDVSMLKEDVSGLKQDVSELKEGQKRLEKRLVKVEINQEKTRKDIDILVEVHKSYQEAHAREHQELMGKIDRRAETIELALKHNSKKLNEMEEDMRFAKYKLFEDQRDIFAIKNRLGMK